MVPKVVGSNPIFHTKIESLAICKAFLLYLACDSYVYSILRSTFDLSPFSLSTVSELLPELKHKLDSIPLLVRISWASLVDLLHLFNEMNSA